MTMKPGDSDRLERYEPSRYWSELVSVDATLQSVAYPWLSESFNRQLYRAMKHAVLHALAATNRSDLRGASVVEIGPGTGVWVELWERLGASRIVGVDLSAGAVDRLSERYPGCDFYNADISEEIVPVDGRFDIVSAMSVLLHITDDARFGRAISNIAQLLKPDGTLVVMDPIVARQWWGAPFDETSNSKARRVNDWVAILRRNGLEICGMFPVTYLLANPVDTKHRLSFRALSLYWSVVSALVGRRERVGGLIGGTLFQLDRVFLHVAGGGPSTKVLLARPTGSGGS